MLLSIDWDAYSGTRELVFDAPIWGTPDREHDRLDAWRGRVQQRGGHGWNTSWEVLAADFPLYNGWQDVLSYAGIPAWATLSHADAYAWVQQFGVQDVLNIDSHHDLYSRSGDGGRVRPGNWAGRALEAGLIRQYTCQYPQWHAGLPVAEGYDLPRTWEETAPHLSPAVQERVNLSRADTLPPRQDVTALLLVQSPSWCNPAHDAPFWELVRDLGAQLIENPLERG